MERQYTPQLQVWKESVDRKPLVLLGVRQAGKTHLLETFGTESLDQCSCVTPQFQTRWSAGKLSTVSIRKISFACKTCDLIDNFLFN